MTNETLALIAQRLIEMGKLNLEAKTYHCSTNDETLTLDSLREFYKHDLNEIAALAVLDGSILIDKEGG
jgi:hypothetical protein